MAKSSKSNPKSSGKPGSGRERDERTRAQKIRQRRETARERRRAVQLERRQRGRTGSVAITGLPGDETVIDWSRRPSDAE